ncbi:uncharacterized protein LOC130078001 isoform X3 [Rhinichthys klamathensis goyatoka]|uniref:uncharacterized protein LOC130078001 isoform X3 n=1 Tax=Rhinichthys klamathensis goyatoka TaxID=3034132 RepID=UPI0024B5A6B4|nr:uncharacterized protein LOC130078001 isoform X3 [Rhinichthys klamathensis goyatoka]
MQCFSQPTMSSDQEMPPAIFDRIFNSISRARQQLSANTNNNLLTSTRRLFRRRVQGLHRPPGRQENSVWQIHLFLLSGPDIEILPSATELERVANMGLGRPLHETTGRGIQRSKIQLNWTLSELNNFVCQCYPTVNLNLIGFHLARAGKGRKIEKVHANSVKDLKKAIGKSRLYIVPRAEVSQVMTPSTAIPQNSQQSSSTTALDETSFSAETTESVNLCEWRAVRSQQDEEYNASLLADIEKDRRRRCYEVLEEKRKKAIEERRQRMAARVEPLDGEYLKAKYPNGDVNKRKFIMSDPIQVLFDFIGKDEMASEVFRIQEATSSNAIESTSTGSISDHGIKPFCTLYVLWTSPFDNLEKDCDPVNVAQPPVDSPFVQSSVALSPVALSPVQTPVALSPVQTPVALSPVQSPVALSPVQTPVALSPVQSPVALSPVQTPVALSPVQSPVALSPVQSPVALSPVQSPVALSPVQTPVALSPVQSPVALSPVQSPVALSPVQSPVALSPVQSPVALSPVQSSVALSRVQSPVALPSVQPSVALFTAQTPFIHFNFEDQPTEPIVIDIDEETPLSSPSPQQSDIVDLSLIDQGRSVALDEVDLQTILKKLQSKIDGNICPTANQINVFRENILQCSLQAVKRRRFNPQAKLDVVFVDAEENGEGAIDEGGPTREYLRLLMRAIHQSNVFQGHEKDRSLALDTQALENRLYASVGKMIAMCVVHGGVGPHFFSERLFQQICGMPTSSASVDEVGGHTLREQLIKIQEATTVQEANCAIAEAADSLSIIGALRYTSHLTERNSLVQSAAEFFVNGRLRAALDQFSEGLQTLGLLEEMQKYPALFYDMFVNEQRPLQAKDLCSLFYVNFSPQGSNRRAKENQTICYWRDWLIDVEEGETDGVTLEMIMEFVTGASTVPPLGFPHRPEIEFLHQDRKIFPEANTCLIILRLPIHTEYEMFKTYMTEGIIQSPYFGVA